METERILNNETREVIHRSAFLRPFGSKRSEVERPLGSYMSEVSKIRGHQ